LQARDLLERSSKGNSNDIESRKRNKQQSKRRSDPLQWIKKGLPCNGLTKPAIVAVAEKAAAANSPFPLPPPPYLLPFFMRLQMFEEGRGSMERVVRQDEYTV